MFGAAGRRWLATNHLQPITNQPALIEQLWYLLPKRAVSTKTARQSPRRLRHQVAKLKTMQDRHGIQV